MAVFSGLQSQLPLAMNHGDVWYSTDTGRTYLGRGMGTGPFFYPVEVTSKTLIFPNDGTLPVAGPPGPAGPQGDTVTGPQGPQGTQGEQGVAGCAGDHAEPSVWEL